MTDSTLASSGKALDVEHAVRQRYSNASQTTEPSLCCPVSYDTQYLTALPDELVQRDYGCGDPSKYLVQGETVLDLGSGGGKICYIASQIVGPHGTVIGVDMNDEMLALARRYQQQISQDIGWNNVRFYKGRIQDLGLDLDRFHAYLQEHPIGTASDWLDAQRIADEMRQQTPMVASGSVDVVISNCVLNLVRPEDRQQMFDEIYRVLRRGGRAVISDIVSDEPVGEHLRSDPQLWSGCISGAFQEHELLQAFEQAQFYGVELVTRDSKPWAVVEGIEFRSVTVRAFKGKDGPCLDHNQAVIYRGPWKSVTDDDGHVLRRGLRTAVCQKTFHLYTRPPYRDQLIAIPPHDPVDPETAADFDCRRSQLRHPRETKGTAPRTTSLPQISCCGGDSC